MYGPLLCVPKSTFPDDDILSDDLKQITFTLLKELVETAKPSPNLTGSFGDQKLCQTVLKCIWTQMVMDGAEDVEEPESRGMFRTVLAEASSIVHSMFGKLILDFTKIHHNLPSTALKPSDEWTAFESRFDESYSASKGA
jgi:hypothetical protein